MDKYVEEEDLDEQRQGTELQEVLDDKAKSVHDDDEHKSDEMILKANLDVMKLCQQKYKSRVRFLIPEDPRTKKIDIAIHTWILKFTGVSDSKWAIEFGRRRMCRVQSPVRKDQDTGSESHGLGRTQELHVCRCRRRTVTLLWLLPQTRWHSITNMVQLPYNWIPKITLINDCSWATISRTRESRLLVPTLDYHHILRRLRLWRRKTAFESDSSLQRDEKIRMERPGSSLSPWSSFETKGVISASPIPLHLFNTPPWLLPHYNTSSFRFFHYSFNFRTLDQSHFRSVIF